MTKEEMIAKRDELAETFDKASWYGRRNLDYFEAGFDACYKLMEAENAELKSSIEKLSDIYLIVDVVEKWQHFWMNQRQNNEEDFQNYFNRAIGVDANMRHSIAEDFSKYIRAALKADEGEG